MALMRRSGGCSKSCYRKADSSENRGESVDHRNPEQKLICSGVAAPLCPSMSRLLQNVSGWFCRVLREEDTDDESSRLTVLQVKRTGMPVDNGLSDWQP